MVWINSMANMWNRVKWSKQHEKSWESNGEVEIEKLKMQGEKEYFKVKEKEMRRKKIQEHFENLINTSTIHGLHYCFDKKHFLRRIIWFIVLMVAVGFLAEKLLESARKFFDYPFSTKTTMIYSDSMVFPAVSICNLNDFRKSVMNGTKLDSIMGPDFLERIGEISGEEYANTTRAASHNLEQMLHSCYFKEMPCSVANFTSFYHAQGSRCFTFNSGKDGTIHSVNGVGTKHSLELTLDTEHYDYHRDTTNAGIHLILHGQQEIPVKMQGILLSPGMLAYVSASKKVIKNLPKPYKTNCGSLKLPYSETYSLNSCWLDLVTKHVEDKCSCRDWFMPVTFFVRSDDGNFRVCSINESMSCMWNAWVAFDTNKDYHCPLPCLIENFITTVSFALFPSNKESERLSKAYNLKGTNLENRLFLRDNLLKVVIFYGDLTYELMEQEPSYDLMVLLGDIGGQLGLFLGASILTYLEVFDCLAMVIYTKYFELFKPKGTRI